MKKQIHESNDNVIIFIRIFGFLISSARLIKVVKYKLMNTNMLITEIFLKYLLQFKSLFHCCESKYKPTYVRNLVDILKENINSIDGVENIFYFV